MADFIAIDEIKKYIDDKYVTLNDKITNINSNLSYWNPVPVNDVKLVKQGGEKTHILFSRTYVSNKSEMVRIEVPNLYGTCYWELRVKAVSNEFFAGNVVGGGSKRVFGGYTLTLNDSTTNIANRNSYFTTSELNDEGKYEASWVVNNTSEFNAYKKDIMPTDVFWLTTNFSCPSNISVACTYQFKLFYDIIDQGNTNSHSVIKRLWHINPDDFWPAIADISEYKEFSTAFYTSDNEGSTSNPRVIYYQKLPSELNLNKTEILCPSGFNLYTANRTIDYGTNKPSSIIIKEYY